jgi:hypothetical protein
MAHAPQHPHNPCSLADNEQTPAKIWEMLRRNTSFRKAVARLEELDKRPRLTDDTTKRHAREIGLAMVDRLGDIHGFAGGAIQWLVPEPLFEIHHVAIPANFDVTGKDYAPLVTLKLQEGFTADPEDKAHWRTFEAHGDQDAQSVANCNGRPWRRGPHIHLQTSDDPRFRSKVDPVKEWRDYFADGRKFTLETPWCDAPPQFKREFCFLWRYLDSRTTNPITGTRIDSPREHETGFFSGWSMMSCFTKQSFQEEDLTRAIMFDDLAKHYRVFAFPKSIRSRTEARRMADWLVEQLCRLPDGTELPPREPEIYGTPLQWDVFLFAGKCDDDALLNAYRQAKPQVKAIERLEKWRKERLNYIEHFRAIEHEVARIFPVKMPPPQS